MIPRLHISPRLAAAAATAALAVLGAATPASASFHVMKVNEVFAGAPGQPAAQFVELKMLFSGQNFVQGHHLFTYDAAGLQTGDIVFPNNVGNGANQATILIGTPQAAAFFGITPNFTMNPTLSAAGGKVCFEDIDCVSWGSYTGPSMGTGTPFRQSGGLLSGFSAQRDPSRGDPAVLDFPDDTDDSAADFDLKHPTPLTNTGGTGQRGVVSMSGGRVRLAAAAGATDNVTLSRPGGGANYLVRNTGRAMQAGAGCQFVNVVDVRCPVAGTTGATLELGDKNDVAAVTTALGTVVNAGLGNDVLTGGGGHDTLNGMDGNDTLDGGTGADELTGGIGIDTVTYATRGTGVTVTLDGAANDGNSTDDRGDGTRDKVVADNLIGSKAGDRLTGDGLANRLTGGLGGDLLSALGGDDTIKADDDVKDTIYCGTGTDVLDADQSLDVYTAGPNGCEDVG